MIDLVKGNYVRQLGNGANFTVDIDPLPASTDTYFKETLKAAEEIYSRREGQLHVMYSGGVDSEYALRVFVDLKMDVVPVIIQLSNYNSHDTAYAFKFCQQHNLTPKVIDIDFDQFVISGQMVTIAKQIKSSVYHRSATVYAAGQLDGTVLFGDGEPYIKLNTDTNVWQVLMEEHEFSMGNYFKQQGIHGTPYFNSYTPAMMSAFFNCTRMKELAEHVHPGKLGSNSSKQIIYNTDNNFNLEARPKYHGYETIETSDIFKHDEFKEFELLKEQYGGIYREDYFTFIKRLCIQ
jgi:hypothetical protein